MPGKKESWFCLGWPGFACPTIVNPFQTANRSTLCFCPCLSSKHSPPPRQLVWARSNATVALPAPRPLRCPPTDGCDFGPGVSWSPKPPERRVTFASHLLLSLFSKKSHSLQLSVDFLYMLSSTGFCLDISTYTSLGKVGTAGCPCNAQGCMAHTTWEKRYTRCLATPKMHTDISICDLLVIWCIAYHDLYLLYVSIFLHSMIFWIWKRCESQFKQLPISMTVSVCKPTHST